MNARDVTAVRDLVARGATVICDQTAELFEAAIIGGHADDLRLLLEAGLDADTAPPGYLMLPSRSMALALEAHAFGGQGLEVARLLLAHGATPDQRATYQWGLRTHRADDSDATYEAYDTVLDNATPLIAAAAAGRLEFARLLLNAGADPDAQDAQGRTALDFARGRNSAALISLLSQPHVHPGWVKPAPGNYFERHP